MKTDRSPQNPFVATAVQSSVHSCQRERDGRLALERVIYLAKGGKSSRFVHVLVDRSWSEAEEYSLFDILLSAVGIS